MFDSPVRGSMVAVLPTAEIQAMDLNATSSPIAAEAETNVETSEPPSPAEPSALSRIPRGDDGELMYEAADADTAWDAIVEEAGDEALAKRVVDSMVADKEAALKKAEKAKPRAGTTPSEKIAAERERMAAIDNARSVLDHWKRIALVPLNRKADENARLRREGRRGSGGNAPAGERSKGTARNDDSNGRTGISYNEQGGQRDVADIARRQHNNLGATEIRLSDEVDENGIPFVISENGTTIFGEVREDSGLTPAPIKLSKGYQDEDGKGYGLVHIEANHGDQIRRAGFKSVEDFVYYVAGNYDEENIRVGKRRSNVSPTFLLQTTDTYDNTLFVEMSKDGSYWNVNSAGIFRKGYSNKKETVAKTEPQQPNNAVSTGSSLSENEEGGITSSESNGKPTVSANKDSDNANIPQTLGEKVSQAEAESGTSERNSSLLYVKTFIGKDGQKVYYFKSVTVKKDGYEVVISNHYDRSRRIRDALKKGKCYTD